MNLRVRSHNDTRLNSLFDQHQYRDNSGLFHLNVHGGGGGGGGGGGWNAHLLKNHGGRGSRMKKFGVYMKRNHWGGGGGSEIGSVPPPPPHVHSNGIALTYSPLVYRLHQ